MVCKKKKVSLKCIELLLCVRRGGGVGVMHVAGMRIKAKLRTKMKKKKMRRIRMMTMMMICYLFFGVQCIEKGKQVKK